MPDFETFRIPTIRDIAIIIIKLTAAHHSERRKKQWVTWIRKDLVVHTATVHRDSSTSLKCRWRGANQGAPQPQEWEYSETLPIGTTMVGNKAVQFIPCGIKQCMNNRLED